MQILKVWTNWRLLGLVYFAYLYGLVIGATFEPCIHPVKNEPCNMTCHVPNLLEVINIKCNGSSKSTCAPIGCGSNTYKEDGNKVIFTIASLSYSSDTCDWSCTFATTTSPTIPVKIFSGYSSKLLNLTSQSYADGVNLTATAECLYPSKPTVFVQYKDQNGGQYISLSQQQVPVVLLSSDVPGGCSFDIEKTTTAIAYVSGELAELKGKSVFFRMKFSQYPSAIPGYTEEAGPFYFKGLTTLSSTISSDMSTTVSEPLSTISSDLSTTVSEPLSTINSDVPATVSEVPPPSVTSSSSGLPQEIVITIISSILAVGVLVTLLIVLVVKQCRQKNRETLAKNKENHFTIKQGNFTKKDASKSSIEPRKSKFSGKRNTKQESISLNKFKHTQFNNSQAPMDRMNEHYPQTSDYMYLNNSGNQHVFNVFNHSHAERNMYGNRHHSYPKSQSRPNHRMVYLSPYPEHPGHYEGMFQYDRANNLYQRQQMYQRPYVAQYDHRIKDKQINERIFEGRTYERNWDSLY